jgi:hypothetical protein
MMRSKILIIARSLRVIYGHGMTVSHKRTFFENIESYDERVIIKEIRRMLASNAADNQRFNLDRYRRGLAHLPTEMAERVIAEAMKPHSGDVNKTVRGPTAADMARQARKAVKSNMKSRRQPR